MSIAELYVTFCTYLSGPSTIWLQLSFQFHIVLFPLQDHYSYSKINHSSLNLAPFYQLGAGLPRWLSSKQTNKKTCLLMQEMWVLSLGQEDPLWRKWQPTLVFLPGKSYGERRQAGYSPWGRKRATKQQQQISVYTKTSPLVYQTSLLVYQKLTCPSRPSPNMAPKKHVLMPLAWSVWSPHPPQLHPQTLYSADCSLPTWAPFWAPFVSSTHNSKLREDR